MSTEIENLDGTDDALNLSGLPPIEVTPAPGFLRFMPDLIKRIHALGGKVGLNDDGSLSLEGFYKNGPMRLEVEEGANGEAKLVAVDKRNRKNHITTIDDLVQVNFNWWKISNAKGVYLLPERPWLDQFIEKKWVKKKIIYEPNDTDGSDV